MVTRSTRGWSGQRASSARSSRAVVLFPTATLPATPMTYGGPRLRGAEELRGRGVQLLRRRHVQVEQTRQRQVDLDDLLHRDRLVQAAQPLEIGLGQRQRRGLAQPRPLVARERHVAGGACRPRLGWSSCGPRPGALPTATHGAIEQRRQQRHTPVCPALVPGPKPAQRSTLSVEVEVAFQHRLAAYPSVPRATVDVSALSCKALRWTSLARWRKSKQSTSRSPRARSIAATGRCRSRCRG